MSAGRRGGESGTRDAILSAARDQFAGRGYHGASLRTIAAAAGVDTGLIRHYFGSKDELFDATVQIPPELVQRLVRALAGDRDGVGERMVDTYLGLWEDPASAEPLRAIVRSAISSDRGADRLGAIVSAKLLREVVPALVADQGDVRAALAGAHLMGIALARYVVRVEPMAGLDRKSLVAIVGPTIQRYLTGPLPAATPIAAACARRPDGRAVAVVAHDNQRIGVWDLAEGAPPESTLPVRHDCPG